MPDPLSRDELDAKLGRTMAQVETIEARIAVTLANLQGELGKMQESIKHLPSTRAFLATTLGGTVAGVLAIVGVLAFGGDRFDGGVQVAEAAAFDTVPPDTPYESVAALYPALNATRPGSVRVCPVQAESHDIGTPLDYFRTSMAFAEREGTRPAGDSILWDGVEIGEGAVVDRCIVTDGARIPARSTWTGQIIRRLDGALASGEHAAGNLAVSSLW